MGNQTRWSKRVTETSDALDLEKKVFTRTPRAIALSLKRSAERSKRRKTTPFRFRDVDADVLPKRAGKNLAPPAKQRKIDDAKQALRRLFGRA